MFSLKSKYLLTLLLGLFVLTSSVSAQNRKDVEDGIAKIENLIEKHEWHEAFVKLYSLSNSVPESDTESQYLVEKQRYRMYYRLNKRRESTESLDRMYKLALSSRKTDIVTDMYVCQAGYYMSTGNTAIATECYRKLADYCTKGMNDAEREKCFKGLIAKAKDNPQMKRTITQIFDSWKDSIASVQVAQELDTLKVDFAEAQALISEKQDTISRQTSTIVLLSALVLIAVAVTTLLLLLIVRNFKRIKSLKSLLNATIEAGKQKSELVRNISSQLRPSLERIALDKGTTEVEALGHWLDDIDNYIACEEKLTEGYEKKDTNIAALCAQVVDRCAAMSINVSCEASKISFPLNAEATTSLLVNAISELSKLVSAERTTLAFSKRNPHTAQFQITLVGEKLPSEVAEKMFVAFGRKADLPHSTGLVLPTCAIMALRMGGTLSLDAGFARGIRLNLQITDSPS